MLARMTSPWQSSEIYVALLLAIGVTVAVLWAVIRARRGRGAPLRHRVAAGWSAVARHLAGAGAPPELVALALAGYAPRCADEEPVTARLPVAVASTADALGLALPTVQRAVVRAAGDADAAELSLAAIRALEPALVAAPGVVSVTPLWPDAGPALAGAVKAYARMSGVAD
jgi:hypothetical protein